MSRWRESRGLAGDEDETSCALRERKNPTLKRPRARRFSGLFNVAASCPKSPRIRLSNSLNLIRSRAPSRPRPAS